MTLTVFKTECRKERDKRDLAIYNEYTAFMALEGQSKTKVMEHLMRKYNIHSIGTIYVILRRAEDMIKSEE